MNAPTPVSALVHRSTLVTAGVVLIVKLINNLGGLHYLALYIGILTVSLGAVYSVMELDIKKKVAYSTMVHIGSVCVLIRYRELNIAVLYLIVHAVLKAPLFILVGVIITDSYGHQDGRRCNIIGKVELLIVTFLVLSLAGLNFVGVSGVKHHIINSFSSLQPAYCFLLLTLIIRYNLDFYKGVTINKLLISRRINKFGSINLITVFIIFSITHSLYSYSPSRNISALSCLLVSVFLL